jgi:hypothetical protein
MKLPVKYSTGFESDELALIRLANSQAGQIYFDQQQVKLNYQSFDNVKSLFAGETIQIIVFEDNSVMVVYEDLVEVFPDATEYLITLYFGDPDFNDLDEGLKNFLVYQFGSKKNAEMFVKCSYL